MSQSQQFLPPMPVEPVNRPTLSTVNPVNREAEWLGLVARARGRVSMSMTAAAITMGNISLALYSAQENGAEGKHLSFRRMWALGPDFWREMVELICEFHGISVGLSAQDEEDRRIGKAYRELQQQVLRSIQR